MRHSSTNKKINKQKIHDYKINLQNCTKLDKITSSNLKIASFNFHSKKRDKSVEKKIQTFMFEFSCKK